MVRVPSMSSSAPKVRAGTTAPPALPGGLSLKRRPSAPSTGLTRTPSAIDGTDCKSVPAQRTKGRRVQLEVLATVEEELVRRSHVDEPKPDRDATAEDV